MTDAIQRERIVHYYTDRSTLSRHEFTRKIKKPNARTREIDRSASLISLRPRPRASAHARRRQRAEDDDARRPHHVRPHRGKSLREHGIPEFERRQHAVRSDIAVHAILDAPQQRERAPQRALARPRLAERLVHLRRLSRDPRRRRLDRSTAKARDRAVGVIARLDDHRAPSREFSSAVLHAQPTRDAVDDGERRRVPARREQRGAEQDEQGERARARARRERASRAASMARTTSAASRRESRHRATRAMRFRVARASSARPEAWPRGGANAGASRATTRGARARATVRDRRRRDARAMGHGERAAPRARGAATARARAATRRRR